MQIRQWYQSWTSTSVLLNSHLHCLQYQLQQPFCVHTCVDACVHWITLSASVLLLFNYSFFFQLKSQTVKNMFFYVMRKCDVWMFFFFQYVGVAGILTHMRHSQAGKYTFVLHFSSQRALRATCQHLPFHTRSYIRGSGYLAEYHLLIRGNHSHAHALTYRWCRTGSKLGYSIFLKDPSTLACVELNNQSMITGSPVCGVTRLQGLRLVLTTPLPTEPQLHLMNTWKWSSHTEGAIVTLIQILYQPNLLAVR